jgi:hypothetical protein
MSTGSNVKYPSSILRRASTFCVFSPWRSMWWRSRDRHTEPHFWSFRQYDGVWSLGLDSIPSPVSCFSRVLNTVDVSFRPLPVSWGQVIFYMSLCGTYQYGHSTEVSSWRKQTSSGLVFHHSTTPHGRLVDSRSDRWVSPSICLSPEKSEPWLLISIVLMHVLWGWKRRLLLLSH